MTDSRYNATVGQRIDVAPGLMILRVVPDVLPYPFEPGQYTVLGLSEAAPVAADSNSRTSSSESAPPLPTMIRRAYSIASSSRTNEFLEFYLILVASGELSPRLFALRPQDRMFVGKRATGVFTLNRVPLDRHVLLVATGTGLAPYMSMLRSQLIHGGPRRFIVLHGARFSWDLGYRAELELLSRENGQFDYFPSISRPQEDPSWNGLSGYLQDILFSDVLEKATGIPCDPEHIHVFLCGNPAMIATAKAGLVERGFNPDARGVPGDVHTEEYW